MIKYYWKTIKMYYKMPVTRPNPRIYIDPTTDFGFKKLFGEEGNKDVLIDFLNTLLPERHQIVDFVFQKPEQIPEHEEDRKAIFDILCTSVRGETFIIEMQKKSILYMLDRSLYYTTFPIQKQAVRGLWDFKLTPVYFVGILDFDYDDDQERWGKRQLLRSFALRDEEGFLMTDNLHFKMVQLKFFTKTSEQLETRFDKWCYFLKNLETFNVIPNILNEPIFMKALEAAKISNLSPDDYLLYEMTERGKYDMILVEQAANVRGEQAGMKRGMEKGMEKGKIQNQIEMILAAHLDGFTVQQICKFTKITSDKVQTIIDLYNTNKDYETNVVDILEKILPPSME